MDTEALADQALESRPPDGKTDVLAGHRESETRTRAGAAADDDEREIAVRQLTPSREGLPVVGLRQ
jgi:hypothetical protein